jgi:arsenate reductase (glutaredoxin)
VRDALREKEAVFVQLELADATLTDEQLLDAMVAHPILINRPFVVTPEGTRLCRPSEKLLEILSAAQKGPFAKEDGERIIDEKGKLVR